MSYEKVDHPPVEPMRCNRWSGQNAPAYDVQAHHLLCAVCVRGGCDSPPCGRDAADALLDALWDYPHLLLRIRADLDLARAHYLDVYENRRPESLPSDFERRSGNFTERRKDLEICRILGIYPNSTIPAFHAYSMILSRLPSVKALCGAQGNPAWSGCPHSDKGYYERIAEAPRPKLKEQTERGEDMAGEGIWALFCPRTRADMNKAKRTSASHIIKRADRLYIRPNHLLCILCTRAKQEALIEDNLIELRRRIEAEPDIPVTLIEGCCQVCDPCNIYHAGENLCYSAHPKNVLRDLSMLYKLGLEPGATLPARELYQLIFERLNSLKDICGWGDGSNYAPMWAPCAGFEGTALEDAGREGFLGIEPL